MKNILFVPIDNRPVTYCLTKQAADIYKNLNLIMPQRSLMGGLVNSSNRKEILNFIKNQNLKNLDFIILSLDVIAYGGLISSRRCNLSPDEIKLNIKNLKDILIAKKNENPDLKIFALSSIMRISNNNENDEEKYYWKNWGKKIFLYSYNFHKYGAAQSFDIPKEILDDYLNTRNRNFEINKMYLNWLDENILDYLVFCKDDTGEFGLNVLEAEFLQKEIQTRNLNAAIKTGADEIPLVLLSRAVSWDEKIKIKVVYKYPKSKNKISKYEDISVETCVKAQIELACKNAAIQNKNYDIVLFVNNFENTQGDLVFYDAINQFSGSFFEFDAAYIIADINNANGADNLLVEKILKRDFDDNILAYSGWNTSANTIGSALATGIIKYTAKKNNAYNDFAFKKLLATRLLDDWGYQANVRKVFKKTNNLLGLEFYEKKIWQFIKQNFEVKYSLPWNRSFEIEINLE